MRHAAARTVDAVPGVAKSVAVVGTALAAVVAGVAALAVALATVVVALPGHPLGLLATVAVALVAVYTLPLAAVRAAARVATATGT